MQANGGEPLSVTLQNGRILEGAVFGELQHRISTIVCFHGTPASRMTFAIMSKKAKECGLRVIAFSRPGIGGSTWDEGRSFESVARDTKEALDQLAIPHYHLLSFSGGTPYLLAAFKVFDRSRVLGCTIVAGAGPWEITKSSTSLPVRLAAGFATSSVARDLAHLHYVHAARGGRSLLTGMKFEQVIDLDTRLAADKRNKLYQDPKNQNGKRIYYAEKYDVWRQTSAAPAADVKALNAWKLDDLKRVSIPDGFPFTLYYGESDIVVPKGIGEQLARELKVSAPTVIPGAAHHSMLEMFSELYLPGIAKAISKRLRLVS